MRKSGPQWQKCNADDQRTGLCRPRDHEHKEHREQERALTDHHGYPLDEFAAPVGGCRVYTILIALSFLQSYTLDF
jgi:hypothetical protein